MSDIVYPPKMARRLRAQAKKQAELVAARSAPRLDPKLWMPQVLPAKPGPDPAYVEYRRANRAYRRAFGRGERHRKILLAVGAARAKERDHAS